MSLLCEVLRSITTTMCDMSAYTVTLTPSISALRTDRNHILVISMLFMRFLTCLCDAGCLMRQLVSIFAFLFFSSWQYIPALLRETCLQLLMHVVISMICVMCNSNICHSGVRCGLCSCFRDVGLVLVFACLCNKIFLPVIAVPLG